MRNCGQELNPPPQEETSLRSTTVGGETEETQPEQAANNLRTNTSGRSVRVIQRVQEPDRLVGVRQRMCDGGGMKRAFMAEGWRADRLEMSIRCADREG